MTQDTFERTVFIHKDKMYRFAKSILADEDEAFDLVQEVMMKLWQRRNELIHVKNVEAFVTQCVRNDAMNRVKRGKIIQLYQNGLTEGVEREKYPSLTKELILKLIQALPEKQKMVIHLRDVEEYEIQEIGETLGMEENAIRVNLMRARQKIKEQLQKIFDYEKRQIEGFGR